MTSPSLPGPRSWGGSAIAAVAVAVALALIPFAGTLSTLAGSISGDPRYVGQILLIEGPRLVLVPLAVAIVTFLSFGAIAPIGGALRMAQVVRRGFVTAAIGLLVAGAVASLLGVAVLLSQIGQGALSVSVGHAMALVGRLLGGAIVGQFVGQFDVLLAVPLAALLLWGWLRREPAAPKV